PVASGATPSKPSLNKSSFSTKASITRTGLSSSIQSSRHSGNNAACPRSTPSTKRFIRSSQRQNQCPENLTRKCVFTQPGSNSDGPTMQIGGYSVVLTMDAQGEACGWAFAEVN